MTDRWHAFECFTCSTPDTSGLVFDVRLPEGETLPIAVCPRCGEECELRGSWEASEGGYGGRGSVEFQALLTAARKWVHVSRGRVAESELEKAIRAFDKDN